MIELNANTINNKLSQQQQQQQWMIVVSEVLMECE